MHLPGLDDLEQSCWQQFLMSSMGLLAELNSRLVDQHGLTLFEVELLSVLDKSETWSARMSDLAAALGVLRSRVTWQIRRLEVQGLVSRRPCQDDRRGVLARITPAGRVRVRSALRTYAEQIRALYLAPMTRQQMIALGDSCRQISDPDAGEGPGISKRD